MILIVLFSLFQWDHMAGSSTGRCILEVKISPTVESHECIFAMLLHWNMQYIPYGVLNDCPVTKYTDLHEMEAEQQDVIQALGQPLRALV